MNILEITRGMGESVIKHQHELYKDKRMEDLQYIVSLTVTVSGIASFLQKEGIEKGEIQEVENNLKDLALRLFVDYCVESRDEDVKYQTLDEFIQDTEEFFDHIWENKEYPY